METEYPGDLPYPGQPRVTTRQTHRHIRTMDHHTLVHVGAAE